MCVRCPWLKTARPSLAAGQVSGRRPLPRVLPAAVGDALQYRGGVLAADRVIRTPSPSRPSPTSFTLHSPHHQQCSIQTQEGGLPEPASGRPVVQARCLLVRHREKHRTDRVRRNKYLLIYSTLCSTPGRSIHTLFTQRPTAPVRRSH